MMKTTGLSLVIPVATLTSPSISTTESTVKLTAKRRVKYTDLLKYFLKVSMACLVLLNAGLNTSRLNNIEYSVLASSPIVSMTQNSAGLLMAEKSLMANFPSGLIESFCSATMLLTTP
jgi:hypothetical protein